jgi:hypothetical protein
LTQSRRRQGHDQERYARKQKQLAKFFVIHSYLPLSTLFEWICFVSRGQRGEGASIEHSAAVRREIVNRKEIAIMSA